MKLQILILTQPSRKVFLEQILSLLEPQISALGIRKFDQVDLLIHHDCFPVNWGVGDKREEVRKKANGDYLCWIDDDDLIAPDYVSRILPLLDGVDYIGWEQQVWRDHVKLKRDFHTISKTGWSDDAEGFHRDISHLNPMRRDLAMSVKMSGGFGEDNRWGTELRKLGTVKTEHYIDSIMYYYLWRVVRKDAKDALDPWRLEMIERLRDPVKTP